MDINIISIVIVWLVPVLAAIGLWYLNKSHDSANKKNSEFGGGSNKQTEHIVESGGD